VIRVSMQAADLAVIVGVAMIVGLAVGLAIGLRRR
jgi:hypothetical protein